MVGAPPRALLVSETLGLPEESRHVLVGVLLVMWLVGKPGFLVFLVSLVLYLKPEPKQNGHFSV